MASSDIPITEQAAAVERAAVSQRGHVNNLFDLYQRGKRSEAEWRMQLQWTPALEAAALTMRRLAMAQKPQEAP